MQWAVWFQHVGHVTLELYPDEAQARLRLDRTRGGCRRDVTPVANLDVLKAHIRGDSRVKSLRVVYGSIQY